MLKIQYCKNFNDMSVSNQQNQKNLQFVFSEYREPKTTAKQYQQQPPLLEGKKDHHM